MIWNVVGSPDSTGGHKVLLQSTQPLPETKLGPRVSTRF
jgi:hypothetical protein